MTEVGCDLLALYQVLPGYWGVASMVPSKLEPPLLHTSILP
jgi:hypothetical protein